MAQRIVFSGKQQVELEDFQPRALQAGEVRVATHYSLMSTGTENIVFNRLFEPGSHWDNWVKYPFYPGYSLVGKIVEAHASLDSTILKPGVRVALRAAHASEVVAAAQDCYPIPAGLDLHTAVWFALAKIGFMGARAAQYTLGDSVLIIGAGPIGQMSVRWASAAGAQTIIVADGLAQRLNLAQMGGATDLLPEAIQTSLEKVRQLTNGQGPRVVLDATGAASVFEASLKVVRSRGRVVILGDTGTPTSQHLTGDVITRGLTITGAHDVLNDSEWNDATISKLFFNLIQTNRFRLDNLITHDFRPQQTLEAYRIANERRAETMGIVFNWRQDG
jgi:2-desacetyl-2-hydroxyethyl bacteriochlorophyllide A dehydrogenase